MTYAVISDIHANLEALTAVLADIDARGADRVLCLGDVVGYYADPAPCVDLLRARNILCLRGNHDSVAAGLSEPLRFSPVARRSIEWTRHHLDAEHLQRLGQLPTMHLFERQFVIVHAALHPEPNEFVRLVSEADARATFEVLSRRFPGVPVCFYGHIHHPIVWCERDGAVAKLAGSSHVLAAGARYLINPGSVGLPRDGEPTASYVMFDTEHRSIQFHRVVYDRIACTRKARAHGLGEGVIGRSKGWVYGRVQRGRRMLRARLGM